MHYVVIELSSVILWCAAYTYSLFVLYSVSNALGQGQFGAVSKGMWASPDGRHEVAIKTLKSDATEDDKLKLLQEAAIMGQFSNKNVVRVEGVVTLGEPVSCTMTCVLLLLTFVW